MDPIYLEGTSRTPFVSLDLSGKFIIRGRSIHENPSKFFDPLVDWIYAFIQNNPTPVIFDIELEYFNSGSARFILEILGILKESEVGKNLIINWYYEDGDEDLLERGQYYESLLDIPFNFIEFQ